ncbi:MAG: transcriptional regulator with XRE-family HTH domain [Candidatus Paceibacteria bacterium]|jgi:transcriptional regulator with XRE-family HTH domain
MVRNEEKYEQAVGLRKRGFTLEEIAKVCEISKSTASIWLKNKAFSALVTKQNVKRAGAENAKRLQLVAKARGGERKRRYADAATSAKVEFAHYQTNPLFLAGLTAYVAAGDLKDDRVIRFSNVSPELHRLFVRFCIEFLGIEKQNIHLWLHLYEGASEERVMKIWSKVTTIPYSQFYKNQFVNKGSRKPLHSGVGNTIIGSTYHKQKLKAWVQLVKKSW